MARFSGRPAGRQRRRFAGAATSRQEHDQRGGPQRPELCHHQRLIRRDTLWGAPRSLEGRALGGSSH